VGWGDQEQGERRIDDFVMMEQFYFFVVIWQRGFIIHY
jgi:hypothetical protein